MSVAECIDHHGMIDHQIDRRERIDALGIAAQIDHRLTHRGEIDHGRHPGEILHQHARRAERDLAVGLTRLQPRADSLDIPGRDRAAILQPHQILEQHLQGKRQRRKIAQLRRRRGVRQAVVGIALAGDFQRLLGLQRVLAGIFHFWAPETASALDIASAKAQTTALSSRLDCRRSQCDGRGRATPSSPRRSTTLPHLSPDLNNADWAIDLRRNPPLK